MPEYKEHFREDIIAQRVAHHLEERLHEFEHKLNKIMATLADLKTEIASLTGAVAAETDAVTAITVAVAAQTASAAEVDSDISTLLKAIKDGGNAADFQEEIDALKSSQSDLASNTATLGTAAATLQVTGSGLADAHTSVSTTATATNVSVNSDASKPGRPSF